MEIETTPTKIIWVIAFIQITVIFRTIDSRRSFRSNPSGQILLDHAEGIGSHKRLLLGRIKFMFKVFGVLGFAAMGDGQIELLLRMIDQAFDRKSSLRQAAKTLASIFG